MKKIGCLVEWGLDFFLSSRLSKISLRGFLAAEIEIVFFAPIILIFF